MAIKDKELEKEMKAMVLESMQYSKKLVGTAEDALTKYIDKKFKELKAEIDKLKK